MRSRVLFPGAGYETMFTDKYCTYKNGGFNYIYNQQITNVCYYANYCYRET